jgi:hypothetical protein
MQQHLVLQGPLKNSRIGIFAMKICHPATLPSRAGNLNLTWRNLFDFRHVVVLRLAVAGAGLAQLSVVASVPGTNVVIKKYIFAKKWRKIVVFLIKPLLYYAKIAS